MQTKKAPYRNAVRSRQLIRDAFMQLMRKKDVSEMKAKEIIELANVSKGTFYAHFNGVWEVFREIEAEYVALMFKVFADRPGPVILEDLLPLFLGGLEEIEKDRDIFLILFRSSGGDSFLGKVKQTFLDHMMIHYAGSDSFQSREQARGFFLFVAGGALTLIREWIESGNRAPSERVAYFLNQYITRGIQAIECPAAPLGSVRTAHL